MRFLHIAHVLDRNALFFRNNDLAGLGRKVKARDFAAQTLRHKLELDVVFVQTEGIERKELGKNLLGRVAQRLQEDRHRHLAPAVDAEVQIIFRVVLEVEPRSAVRNDARGKEQLTRRVRLAAIMIEEHAGRAMQLGYDHALGAVDYERARR